MPSSTQELPKYRVLEFTRKPKLQNIKNPLIIKKSIEDKDDEQKFKQAALRPTQGVGPLDAE